MIRSSFLTILCILSFISCTLGLIESGTALLDPDQVSDTPFTGHKPPQTEEEKQDLRNFYQDNANSDIPMPEEPDVVRNLSLGQFIYSLLTLVGSLLMFRLRRAGLFVYVTGILAGFVVPISLVGLPAINHSFGVFFSVLFAILYGYCWREMR